MSSISKERTWTPTWNTYWSTSHMWTRYSSNLSWALMPWILNFFNNLHYRRALTVPGSFKAMKSSSSCSRSLHSDILTIKYLYGDEERKLASSIVDFEILFWENACTIFWVFGHRRWVFSSVRGFHRWAIGHLRRSLISAGLDTSHLRQPQNEPSSPKTHPKTTFKPK